MNVAELVDVISYRTGETKVKTREILKAALDVISEEVQYGGRVSIVGFGSFYKAERKERIGRNPQTKEIVKIESTAVPRFKAGKDFREKVKHNSQQK